MNNDTDNVTVCHCVNLSVSVTTIQCVLITPVDELNRLTTLIFKNADQTRTT